VRSACAKGSSGWRFCGVGDDGHDISCPYEYHACTIVESAFVGNRRGTIYRSRPVGSMAVRSACADKIGKWRCRGVGNDGHDISCPYGYHACTIVESAFVGNRRGTIYRSRPVRSIAVRSACAKGSSGWRFCGVGDDGHDISCPYEYHACTIVELAFVGNRRGTIYRSRPVGFMAVRSACAKGSSGWRCCGVGDDGHDISCPYDC